VSGQFPLQWHFHRTGIMEADVILTPIRGDEVLVQVWEHRGWVVAQSPRLTLSERTGSPG
jgi:hypothetical protein